MHGPAFDDSGDVVDREVPVGDVAAFEAAGYTKGGKPKVESDAAVAVEKPKGKAKK